MKRIIFHIDVNNAFLSWSAIDLLKKGSKLDIRTIPSVVGGDEKKRTGIVVAKSFPAKKAGIVTGEPLYSARRKVDKLYIVQTNKGSYEKYSNAFYELLCKYSPVIERYSIDECFMDMTGMELIYDNLVDLAYKIKDEIYNTLGFTVNVGVGNSKLCAKMASDFEKPNKVHTLFINEIKEKMWPLKVDDLFMVGKSSSSKLHQMGLNTIGDLAKADVKMLNKKFGKHGIQMWEYANGIDNSEVQYQLEKPKGVGNSITLPENITEIEKLEEILLALTEQVTYRLRRYELLANTVNVQLRTKDFEDTSHQGKLIIATSSTKEIYGKAKQLLHQMFHRPMAIRLIGVRVDNLVEKEEQQLSLFYNDKTKKQEKLDKIVDELKNKYGYSKITRAGKMGVENLLKLKDIKK